MEPLKEVSATLQVRNAWIPVSPVYRVVSLDISNLGKTESWIDCMLPLGVLVLLFIFLNCLSPSYNFSCSLTLGNFMLSLDFEKASETEMSLVHLKIFYSFLAMKYYIYRRQNKLVFPRRRNYMEKL